MRITKINFSGLLLVFLLMFVVSVVVPQIVLANTHYITGVGTTTDSTTDTTDIDSMSTTATLLATLQSLIARVQELQSQLAVIQNEVRNIIGNDVREGLFNDDIRDVQEFLATDPSIYPEGLITGYFGNLTKKALKRFQSRHELKETGEVDEDTKDLLEEYFAERDGEDFPKGFLRSPGIAKKMEDRVCKNDEHGNGTDFVRICSDGDLESGNDSSEDRGIDGTENEDVENSDNENDDGEDSNDDEEGDNDSNGNSDDQVDVGSGETVHAI